MVPSASLAASHSTSGAPSTSGQTSCSCSQNLYAVSIAATSSAGAFSRHAASSSVSSGQHCRSSPAAVPSTRERACCLRTSTSFSARLASTLILITDTSNPDPPSRCVLKKASTGTLRPHAWDTSGWASAPNRRSIGMSRRTRARCIVGGASPSSTSSANWHPCMDRSSPTRSAGRHTRLSSSARISAPDSRTWSSSLASDCFSWLAGRVASCGVSDRGADDPNDHWAMGLPLPPTSSVWYLSSTPPAARFTGAASLGAPHSRTGVMPRLTNESLFAGSSARSPFCFRRVECSSMRSNPGVCAWDAAPALDRARGSRLKHRRMSGASFTSATGCSAHSYPGGAGSAVERTHTSVTTLSPAHRRVQILAPFAPARVASCA
mmetsp:Transcript_28054/g.90583  ORF Transcript_28054/g.90583 Transcript_28054/m.90583 type:complete len:379 (+) Transcript_28054:262-1398(+)